MPFFSKEESQQHESDQKKVEKIFYRIHHVPEKRCLPLHGPRDMERNVSYCPERNLREKEFSKKPDEKESVQNRESKPFLSKNQKAVADSSNRKI